MKPMLSAVATSYSLRYPMMVSPKLDGVRCLIIDGVAMSRSMKPIPNLYVQKLFGKKEFNGLDGELIVGPANAKDAYRQTMIGVMTKEGKPNAKFHVFDDYLALGSFKRRLEHVQDRLFRHWEHLKIVQHFHVRDTDELFKHENRFVENGYEGLMIRCPTGPYKHGRSTETEGYLLKLKRFADGDAKIEAVQQFMSNKNEAKINALGHLERSSHKANKVAREKLGALNVSDLKTGVVFQIGSGFTEADRVKLWKDRKKLIGQIVTYKYQPAGGKDKPRFPVFIGFRHKEDM